MSNSLKVFTLEAGTLIHIKGIPFQLAKDTEIIGNPNNFNLVVSDDLKDVDLCEES